MLLDVIVYGFTIKRHYDVTKMSWFSYTKYSWPHYSDVIMGTMTSQITSLSIVYSAVYSGADQREHQSSAHWPLSGENVPFDDVIMIWCLGLLTRYGLIGLAHQKSWQWLIVWLQANTRTSDVEMFYRPQGLNTLRLRQMAANFRIFR